VPRELKNVEAIWGKRRSAASGKIHAATLCKGTGSWFWLPAGAGLALSGGGVRTGCAAQHGILPPQPQSAFAADACDTCAQTEICAQANAKLQKMDNTNLTIQVSRRFHNHTTPLLSSTVHLLSPPDI